MAEGRRDAAGRLRAHRRGPERSGLYVVLGFVVSRSVPEIGVRMALGASPASVLLLFLRRDRRWQGPDPLLALRQE